ncbi:MAG: DUF2927 domain-containing protein [Pseudomonadota bacterium]
MFSAWNGSGGRLPGAMALVSPTPLGGRAQNKPLLSCLLMTLRAVKRWLFAALFMVAGCAPLPNVDVASRQAPARLGQLPPMKTFGTGPAPRAMRANADIARDFMDLSFQMESGRQLATLTRFEGPISLRVVGQAPVTMAPDLGRLLARLRAEAGLNITITQSPSANINIVPLPKAKMQKAVPGAACFVVPNVRDWADFKSARRTPRVDWSRLTERQQVAIFVPSDAAPQELRDCLHEEIAQALGPLNDLYRLPDSVFNDDNIHAVLTGFDMLVLKTYYSRELRNGMTRAEVARALPAILSRINPDGNARLVAHAPFTTNEWKTEIGRALGSDPAPQGRSNAARNAIALSRTGGWRDTREGFSLYALGRLLIGSEPRTAYGAFKQADSIYASEPTTELHRAYVGVQLAAFSLLDGDAQGVMEITGTHLETALRHENAALLASLMMFRAEALELQGRAAEARSVRLDSLGWARYGFGSPKAINARLREIALLNPAKHGRTSF